MKNVFNTVVVLILTVNVIGCAGFGRKMKSFLGGGDSAPPPSAKSLRPKFSDNPNMMAGPQEEKKYRRVNKEIFEKEGLLDKSAGSLWVNEGQGSYLFSQNFLRQSGDLINIQMEGPPRSQIEKKVEVVKKLLDRNRKAEARMVASVPAAGAKPKAPPAPAAAPGAPPAPGAPGTPEQTNAAEQAKNDENDEKESSFDVNTIPSRIIEQLADGSYRIKGSQNFMIGRKEYRVIATGLVHSADIKDDVVMASRMLDPKFDIVSVKRELVYKEMTK